MFKNKCFIKKIKELLILVLLLFNVNNLNIFAAENISVKINNESIQFDVFPQIVDGYTMVPIRQIFEKLNGTVEWNNTEKKDTVTIGNRKIELIVGNNHMSINGVNVVLSTPVKNIDGRVMVALRDAGYAIGLTDKDIKWDSDTKTATLITNSKNDSIKEDNYNSTEKNNEIVVYDYFGNILHTGDLEDFTFTGNGILYINNKKVYDGEFKNGDITGTGKLYKIIDGKEFLYYSGDLDIGKRSGKGKNYWINDDSYDGEFQKDVITGKGTMYFESVGEYTGQFSNGLRSGLGIFKWENGDEYNGYWREDKMNGAGTYTFSDGVKYKGIWENNKLKKVYK